MQNVYVNLFLEKSRYNIIALLINNVKYIGLYGDNGILPARTQVDLKARATLFNKLKQKPTFLWFAPYLGLNVEYMLDVLSLLGIILSFTGYVITLKRLQD